MSHMCQAWVRNVLSMCPRLPSHILDMCYVTRVGHMSQMCNVSRVGFLTCQSCVNHDVIVWSCRSHANHVNHVSQTSVTCQSCRHVSHVNHVSHVLGVIHVGHVSGIGHVSYMLITWRSRVDHVSVTSLSHANPVHRVSHVTQTCWSHANCQLCVSHVLVKCQSCSMSCRFTCHTVFMWQSRVDCVNLMAHVGDVSCSNHVSDMSQICQSRQSCAIMWQSWVTCQPCSSQVSHTCWSHDHVCHLLDTCNHVNYISHMLDTCQ